MLESPNIPQSDQHGKREEDDEIVKKVQQQSNSGEPLSTTTEIKNGQSSSSSQSDGDSNNENLKIHSTVQSPLLSHQPTSSTTENKNVESPNIPQSGQHGKREEDDEVETNVQQHTNSGEPLSTTTEIKNGQSSSSSQSDGDSNNENLKIQSTTQSPLLSRQPTSSTTENKNVGSPNIPQSVQSPLLSHQPTSSTTEIKNGQSSSSSQSDGDSNNENLKIQSTVQSPLLSRQPTSSTTEIKNDSNNENLKIQSTVQSPLLSRQHDSRIDKETDCGVYTALHMLVLKSVDDMEGPNIIYINRFFHCLVCVLLMLSNTVQTDNETVIKDIIKKTNIVTIEFDNGKCRKSVHYYYIQEVCMNSQPPKILNTFLRNKRSHLMNLSNFEDNRSFYTTKVASFPIKYYGEKYGLLQMTQQGIIKVGENSFGSIWALIGDSELAEMQIINNEKEFAVRWPNLTVVSNAKSYQVAVACTIRKNGKISIYYENIPSEIHSTSLTSLIEDRVDLVVGKSHKSQFIYNTILVPSFMIKSKTTVHFTPTSKYCSRQKSRKFCRSVSTNDIKCHWCPKTKTCTNGADIHANKFEENNCFRQSHLKVDRLETATSNNVFNHVMKSQIVGSGLHLFIIISAGLLPSVIGILFVVRFYQQRRSLLIKIKKEKPIRYSQHSQQGVPFDF
ncbi:hypothetical protein EWB00_008218 [Schistosoma japonicum]|uniref:Plexin domain-containing protein n=1 Tax=Schistosoma japonicum TaxID=6182 RepID=A0A4Z2CR39_SCHJA|nr:hypothetical protein EWB00_008218 [Schistosoma japonicum]